MTEESKVFYFEESPTMPNYYIIKIHHDRSKLRSTTGSYNLIMARLLNISYANFLRMCRDSFKATIIGKNTYYPMAYFDSRIAAGAVCDLLNAKASFVLWNIEHPDYDRHKAALENLKASFLGVEENADITGVVKEIPGAAPH